MPKQVKTNFPETIYVKVEKDGDDEFLISSANAADLVDPGVAVMAAEYKLVRAGVVIEQIVSVK